MTVRRWRANVLGLLVATFVQFTRPDGGPIWIAPAQVAYFTRAVPADRSGRRLTDIVTLSGVVGVHESRRTKWRVASTTRAEPRGT